MKSRKGLGPAAGVFMVVGVFMALSGFGVMNSFVGSVSGEVAYQEDEQAVTQLVTSAENKCSDLSAGDSTVSTSITENVEFSEIDQLAFVHSEDEFVFGEDNKQLSGSCDYVFENERTGGNSIGSGQWTVTISGESENNQVTVFIKADD